MLRSLSSRRFWFVNFSVLVIFLLLGYQLLQLTVIRRPALLEVAERQHLMKIEVPALRGPIMDRNGKDLASHLQVPSVFAVPRILSHAQREDLVKTIEPILGLSREYLRERLSRNKSFIWLKRRISHEEAQAIDRLQHPALGITEEHKRFYPQGEMLSHVLGFTNIDNAGIEGLELVLDQELKGHSGARFTKRDAFGREVKALEMKSIPAQNGNRVFLTLDAYIQFLTERALDEAYRKWKAAGASAVVMDPSTGEILAMASRPAYDPNRVAGSETASRRNRAITDMYEPGSVFKIVAVGAALNEKAVTPESEIFCENGEFRYGSRVLHDVHAYGFLSVADVLAKSSNIGTVKVAAMLEPATLQKYIDAFGFGRVSGIDLPGESPGFTRPPDKWSSTSPYNIPMGHEVLVTVLQMANATSVIANGGALMRPFVVSRIEDEAGVVLRTQKPDSIRRVLSPETAAHMRTLMQRVVEEGTGKNARIDGISVGGKTGTAQKVLPGGRGYSHEDFIGSFIGFAPVENPRLAIAVMIDDPGPRYYGGTVAAPVFKDIMEPALLHLGVVPQTAKKLESAQPSFPGNQPRPQSA